MTRSGRCYAPGLSRVKERGEHTEQSDVKVTVLKKKGKEPLNESVFEVEVNEFLNSLSTTSTTLLSSYINY